MNFLFMLFYVRHREGILLYHAASSCVYFFSRFSDLKVSVPGPIFLDREILDEISWENSGRNICCATVAASCLLHVIDVDSGGRFSEKCTDAKSVSSAI